MTLPYKMYGNILSYILELNMKSTIPVIISNHAGPKVFYLVCVYYIIIKPAFCSNTKNIFDVTVDILKMYIKLGLPGVSPLSLSSTYLCSYLVVRSIPPY